MTCHRNKRLPMMAVLIAILAGNSAQSRPPAPCLQTPQAALNCLVGH